MTKAMSRNLDIAVDGNVLTPTPMQLTKVSLERLQRY